MNNFRTIGKIFSASSFFALSLVILPGCAPLQQGLSKVVLMDYDQVNNFRNYEFMQAIDWGGAAEETGITGYDSGSNTKGFWVTYVICNLRNEASQAQAFPYDVNNFFVVYDGKEQFHKPLDPYTFSSLPHNVPANPVNTNKVNEKFRFETQLGPDADTFQPGYQPNVGYRIAIYVTKTSPGAVDTTERLSLRYKNYPNIMNPRNQEPVVAPNNTKKADLLTTCRPQAQ